MRGEKGETRKEKVKNVCEKEIKGKSGSEEDIKMKKKKWKRRKQIGGEMTVTYRLQVCFYH